MAIDQDRFINWCEGRFSNIKIKGNEVKLNSIFADDSKNHLWCNTSKSVYHCWKTENRGSLLRLVMLVDKCSYEDALATLGVEDTSMEEIEKRLEEFFEKKREKEATLEEKAQGFQLPPYSFLIDELSPNNYHRVTAEIYLYKRSLPTKGLFICCLGDYKDRIIIPYYDRDGNLIYYNGRYIGSNHRIENGQKYMCPPETSGIVKSEVIYMPVWPEAGSKIYYTEGEFDALSIAKTGLFAGALGGKNIFDSQIEFMRPYKPVICIDNDEAGREALPKIGDALRRRGIMLGYVMPPKEKDGVKRDWNKLLEKYGPKILSAYLEHNERPYDDDFSFRHKLQKI